MIRYLSRKEFAERIGCSTHSLGNYDLPDPDAVTGEVRGWLSTTVDDWDRNRPGRGKWKKRESEDR